MFTETMFTECDGRTTVTVKWRPLDAADEDRMTFSSTHNSMKQGWTGTFDQLATYLAQINQGRAR